MHFAEETKISKQVFPLTKMFHIKSPTVVARYDFRQSVWRNLVLLCRHLPLQSGDPVHDDCEAWLTDDDESVDKVVVVAVTS